MLCPILARTILLISCAPKLPCATTLAGRMTNSDKASRDINRLIQTARDSGDKAAQITRSRQIQSYNHAKTCDMLVSETSEIFSRCLLHDGDPNQVDTMIELSIGTIVKKMLANGIPVAEDLRMDYAPSAATAEFDPATNVTGNSNSPSNNTTDSSTDEHNAAYLDVSPSEDSRGEQMKPAHANSTTHGADSMDDTMQIQLQSTPAEGGAVSDNFGHNIVNKAAKPKTLVTDHFDISNITKFNYVKEGGASVNPAQGTKTKERAEKPHQTQKPKNWSDNPAPATNYSRGDQHGENARMQSNRRYNPSQETGPM